MSDNDNWDAFREWCDEHEQPSEPKGSSQEKRPLDTIYTVEGDDICYELARAVRLGIDLAMAMKKDGAERESLLLESYKMWGRLRHRVEVIYEEFEGDIINARDSKRQVDPGQGSGDGPDHTVC